MVAGLSVSQKAIYSVVTEISTAVAKGKKHDAGQGPAYCCKKCSVFVMGWKLFHGNVKLRSTHAIRELTISTNFVQENFINSQLRISVYGFVSSN